MIPLERMVSAPQREKLLAAAQARYSCHHFGDVLSGEDWAQLSYLAGRYALPGARIILLRVEDGLFTGGLFNTGQIRGCRAAAVVISSAAVQSASIHAGFAGELFCLEAVAAGFATCWVGETYRREQLSLRLQPGEKIEALIAVGHYSEASAQDTRKRKPLSRFCEPPVESWPDYWQRAAASVQTAPSSRNEQPWRLTAAQDRLTVLTEGSTLELGIAMAHMEIAIDIPHRWRIGLRSAWAVPLRYLS